MLENAAAISRQKRNKSEGTKLGFVNVWCPVKKRANE
jgi:hypothetical protein